MARSEVRFNRILLKLSGEGLAGKEGFGLSADALSHVVREIQQVREMGVEVAIVVGGGNMLRGAALSSESMICEASAHYMGMLATVINALALQESLDSAGTPARVLSAIAMPAVCEQFSRRPCLQYLAQKDVVILAGGTGRPFVTTDTAAALGAVELGADALLKATQVDGVYSADPRKDPKAAFFSELTFDRVINDRLKVMDLSAVELCQRQNVPIVVFNLHQQGNMKKVLAGPGLGTLVHKGE